MIVLDINCFHSVFDSKSSDNADFCHILDWIKKQRYACFVYGGTKYKFELKKIIKKYMNLVNEFKRAGKFVEIDEQKIDNNAVQLKRICPNADFNDEHIVAILNVSGCKLICTKDIRAQEYIKRKDFYSDKKTPRIYSSAKNKKLLSPKYIVELKNRC
jgi:predicted nucleic acid-binding protein